MAKFILETELDGVHQTIQLETKEYKQYLDMKNKMTKDATNVIEKIVSEINAFIKKNGSISHEQLDKLFAKHKESTENVDTYGIRTELLTQRELDRIKKAETQIPTLESYNEDFFRLTSQINSFANTSYSNSNRRGDYVAFNANADFSRYVSQYRIIDKSREEFVKELLK